jgi:NADH dehydrogenase FAD-containing subunit
MSTNTSTENKRLVILGGGAAGLLIAMKLASTKELDITLVDNKVSLLLLRTNTTQCTDSL